jgi:acetylornithine deacetylase
MSATAPLEVPEPVLDAAAAAVPGILRRMVSFDTVIVEHFDPPHEDAEHQEFLAGYLRDLGLEVELFEPDLAEFDHHPMYRPGQTFSGRPILWARLPGRGGGRSLLFNGHMDTVQAEPLEDWTHDPWGAEIVDGRLYGRGSCDMKGGIAAAIAVVQALVTTGTQLDGDLFLNVVPFEEVNGMGTTATMLRGLRADAAVCCEPTELNPLIACRGILLAELQARGRSAHAEIIQPHHSEGGGVSAIDKLINLLIGLRLLNEDWRTRPDKQHWLLSTPYVLPTVVQGGSFASNWPAEATALLNVCYLPGEADADGYGSAVKAELESAIAALAATDSWLTEHPPRLDWLCDFPARELERGHPLVTLTQRAAHRQGIPGSHLVGFDTWADQVMVMKEGGIPCVCFGPGSILNAHAADEFVPLADLEACTRVYADVAIRWTAADSETK